MKNPDIDVIVYFTQVGMLKKQTSIFNFLKSDKPGGPPGGPPEKKLKRNDETVLAQKKHYEDNVRDRQIQAAWFTQFTNIQIQIQIFYWFLTL